MKKLLLMCMVLMTVMAATACGMRNNGNPSDVPNNTIGNGAENGEYNGNEGGIIEDTGDMLQEGVDDIENGVEDVMDGNTTNDRNDPAKEETVK